MFPKKYALGVTERTSELIQFLNDGHAVATPKSGKPQEYFHFTIESPNEITVDKNSIQSEDDLYNEDGFPKDLDLTIVE